MIVTLISFLTTLCIQFGAVGITPFNMISLNSANESYIDTVKSQITGSKSRYWGSFSNYVNIPNDYWIVIKGYNNSGSTIVCLAPNEYVDSTKTTSITCDAYNTDSDNIVSSAKLKFNQYTAFPVATNTTWVDNNANIYGWKTYGFTGENWSLLYCQIPIYYDSQLIINVSDIATIPTLGLGGLGHSGYGSDDDPLESLSNFSGWSSTGHSTNSVSITDPISSVDSSNPTNNLLAQIVNNLKSIYDYLGNINNNIINGFSALFNGISVGFNAIYDEIVSEYTIDFDSVLAAWHETSLYTLVSFVDSTPTTITDTSNDIIISWDFSNLVFGVPDNNINISAIRSISGSFNVSQAFNPSKSVWQPLLLTFLYGFTFWNFIRSIPNIINGVSSVSNSKEVKEKLK